MPEDVHGWSFGNPPLVIQMLGLKRQGQIHLPQLLNTLAYLSANAGKLIRGFRILNKDNKQVGRFALFIDKDDDSLLYYLNAAGDEINLYGVNISEKEKLLMHLQETINQNIHAGHHGEEIKPMDNFLEGSKSE